MSDLNARQNNDDSISMLAAQRQLYSDGKVLTIWLFIVSIIIPFIIVIIKPFYGSNQKASMSLSIISVLVLIIVFLLKLIITKKKLKAAIIQNRFDYTIFEFPWDEMKLGDINEIQGWVYNSHRKYIKKRGSIDSLLNWYPIEYSYLEIEKGRFYCQKCNVYWDYELKKQYKIVLNIICCIAIITEIILAILYDNSTVAEFCVKILVPLVPVILYFYTINSELAKDFIRLDKLKVLITNILELVDNKSIDNETLAKQSLMLQSQIFEHRKNGILVLDIIYNWLKNHQEQVAKQYARQITTK